MRWLWLPLALIAAWKAIRICTAARSDQVSEETHNRLRMIVQEGPPEPTGRRAPEMEPMTRRQTALSRAWRGEQ